MNKDTSRAIADTTIMSSSQLFRLTTLLPALAIGLTVSTSTFTPAQAQLYKWIDDEGNVRYSDRLPVDQRKRGHQKLSNQGRVVETQEAATPPEEAKRLREEKQREEEQARLKAEEEAKIQAVKEHHDKVLLMTFSNENEIIEVEKERVEVITSVIRLLRKNMAKEIETLEDLEKRAKRQYTDQGKEVPGGLAQNIDYFGEKIRGIEHQLELKLAERERLKQQYAEDLIRYRELTKAKAEE